MGLCGLVSWVGPVLTGPCTGLNVASYHGYSQQLPAPDSFAYGTHLGYGNNQHQWQSFPPVYDLPASSPAAATSTAVSVPLTETIYLQKTKRFIICNGASNSVCCLSKHIVFQTEIKDAICRVSKYQGTQHTAKYGTLHDR
jgi:hypothetical protein